MLRNFCKIMRIHLDHRGVFYYINYRYIDRQTQIGIIIMESEIKYACTMHNLHGTTSPWENNEIIKETASPGSQLLSPRFSSIAVVMVLMSKILGLKFQYHNFHIDFTRVTPILRCQQSSSPPVSIPITILIATTEIKSTSNVPEAKLMCIQFQRLAQRPQFNRYPKGHSADNRAVKRQKHFQNAFKRCQNVVFEKSLFIGLLFFLSY